MPAVKPTLSPFQRSLRLLASLFDPRAWLHFVKIVNYYNYTHVQPKRQIRMGHDARISPDVSFANADRITIGARVRLGARNIIWAGPAQGKVVLGDDVMFGPDVFVTAGSYRFNDGSPVTDQPMDEADITIGNDVWVGARVVILPGAHIGHGCIIGANSVVRGKIADMSIAVGAPARIVGERTLGQNQEDNIKRGRL